MQIDILHHVSQAVLQFEADHFFQDSALLGIFLLLRLHSLLLCDGAELVVKVLVHLLDGVRLHDAEEDGHPDEAHPE